MKYRTGYCRFLTIAVAVIVLSMAEFHSSVALAAGPDGVEPTFADVAYGPYESNKLDFWKAASDKPTPVIVEIHGGGFYEGDKGSFRRGEAENIARSLGMGVSLAAINYRFIEAAPLQDILRDSARAIQFLRHNAASWNIDTTRIAAFGDSAGAGTSLWLAFHDDLADPNSSDPVLRESTRLMAAGALAPQASYDFASWPAILHIPRFIWYCANWHVSPTYYHFSALGAYTQKGKKIRADLDMLAMIDPNDPPVYVCSTGYCTDLTFANLGWLAYAWATQTLHDKKLSSPEKVSKDSSLNFDILHHPAHAQAIETTCQSIGVPCTAVYRDTPQDQRVGVFDFILKRIVP